MKNLIYLCLILCLFYRCGSKQEIIEKHVEDGVEVIVNHLESYKIANEPTQLHLEKKLTIDTEKESIAETGLTEIYYFDVDSEGNIYFGNNRPQDNYIIKFNGNGNFVKSFGRKGQGPGELQEPLFPVITHQDEVLVMDEGKSKLFFFTREGDYMKSIPQDAATVALFPLENGNYLRVSVIYTYPSDYLLFSLSSSDLKEIKELERLTYPLFMRGKEKATTPGFLWSVTKTNIYFGNEERGYEINVFDLEGNLVRKIRKDYRKIRIPDEYIKEKTESMDEAWRQRSYFPEYFPPFQCGFVDDKERLFIITNEKGNLSGEYMCDIFNPEGVFFARASVTGIIDLGIIFLPPIARKNLLYCVQEKENGYQKLVVYEMIWK